jgi:Cytochrome b-245 chaperone 1 / Eros
MKILENTNSRLKLHHKPVGIWLIGSLFTGFTLLVIGDWLTKPASTRLECKRQIAASVSCQIQRSTILGVKSYQTVNNVRSVESATRRSGRSRIPYLVLTTPAQRVNISNSERQTGTSEQIQNFLSNSRSTSFAITYARTWTDAIGFFGVTLVASVLGGVFCFVSMKVYTFDRTTQKLITETKGIRGTRSQVYSLDQISSVTLEEKQTKKGRTYSVVLWLKEGQQIELPSSLFSSNRSSEAKIESVIRHFLNG